MTWSTYPSLKNSCCWCFLPIHSAFALPPLRRAVPTGRWAKRFWRNQRRWRARSGRRLLSRDARLRRLRRLCRYRAAERARYPDAARSQPAAAGWPGDHPAYLAQRLRVPRSRENAPASGVSLRPLTLAPPLPPPARRQPAAQWRPRSAKD